MGRNDDVGSGNPPAAKQDLAEQALAEQPYTELYRQYLPRILNYIRLRVDGEDLAQDLTAETFERAVSRQHTLRRPEAFGAWLFAIARNTVAAYYRRRRPAISLEQTAGRPAPGLSPPEAVIRREELARLQKALATLSERDQEIIRLRFGAGLGNKEIGEITRLRAGHVAVILYRALRKLRTRLEVYESTSEAGKERMDDRG